MSTDGTFELWVSIRGSLMFARYVLKDGKEISMELTELIRADPSEVSKMLRVRAKLLEEAAGGRTANLRRYNVFRWTPWGRRYDRRVNAARMHGGEVAMTVDDVGCLVSWSLFVRKHLYGDAVPLLTRRVDLSFTTNISCLSICISTMCRK